MSNGLTFRFLDLPVELRYMIYRHLFRNEIVAIDPRLAEGFETPCIARTCRSLRSESLLVFYDRATFEDIRCRVSDETMGSSRFVANVAKINTVRIKVLSLINTGLDTRTLQWTRESRSTSIFRGARHIIAAVHIIACGCDTDDTSWDSWKHDRSRISDVGMARRLTRIARQVGIELVFIFDLIEACGVMTTKFELSFLPHETFVFQLVRFTDGYGCSWSMNTILAELGYKPEDERIAKQIADLGGGVVLAR